MAMGNFKLITGFTFAAALVVVASVIALTVTSLVGGRATALFIAAVTLSAWLWGRGPGLFAAILSALALNYYFVPPLYSWGISSTDEATLY